MSHYGESVRTANKVRQALEDARREWISLHESGLPEEILSKPVMFGWADLQSVSQGFMTTSNEACSPMGTVFKRRPTHWQPLPAPPASMREGERQG
jgi:hypothetical protein